MNNRRNGAAASLLALLAVASTGATAANGDLYISGNVFGNTMEIQTSSRFAGAVSSLTFRGVQFIDQADHGRELQSAVTLDLYGECLNPTEAGSRDDGAGWNSTSVLLASTVSPNRLATSTQMAYWLPAGAYYGQQCSDQRPTTFYAQNTTNLSNYVLDKSVTIGPNGISNAIEYFVTFRTPEARTWAQFEALTGYMPGSFSSFFTYDPKTLAFSAIGAAPAAPEQALPLIFATGDGRSAMGIYSPDLPQSTTAPNAPAPNSGYGRFNIIPEAGVVKWNAVFRMNNVPAGAYGFRHYVVVGTLQEVKQGMSAVYQMYQSQIANVYRFYAPWSSEHFFTGSSVEGSNAGFVAEGVGFMVLRSATAGAMPLYRCNNGKHFASTAPNCEGASNEGQLGYIYGSQVAGSTPLYRFYQPSTGDHLETTNYNEGVGAGYQLDGVLGYVPTQGG